MKRYILIITIIIFFAIFKQPMHIYAKTVSQIDKELNQLQEKAQKAEREKEVSEKKQQKSQLYIQKNKRFLEQVHNEIDSVSIELTQISFNIEKSEEELKQSSIKLDEAKRRLKERSNWRESRIRLIYTERTNSYLDLLLSSTNLSDFFERADLLKEIVIQDRIVIDEYKRDKVILEEQQKNFRANYLKLEALRMDAKERNSILQKKEKEKQQLIAKYNMEIEEFEDISEDQEAILIKLAAKRAILEKEKNKIRSTQIYAYKEVNTKDDKGSMALPIPGARLSSQFGTRVHPVTGEIKMHKGVDFAAPQGTEIRASEDGVVIVAEWWSGYGNTVIIDHGDSIWTLYAHIRDNGFEIAKGDTVKRGQAIAQVGSTGTATGNNLHFEVRINGNPIDPLPYVQ